MRLQLKSKGGKRFVDLCDLRDKSNVEKSSREFRRVFANDEFIGGAMKKLLLIALSILFVAGCGDDNDVTQTPVDEPTVEPQNLPQPWRSVNLLRYHSEGCEQTSFLVRDAGGWTAQECDMQSNGTLTAFEQSDLEELATAALNASKNPDACTEELQLDRDYVAMDGDSNRNDRDFRPEHNCQIGGVEEADALRLYLAELRERYAPDLE